MGGKAVQGVSPIKQENVQATVDAFIQAFQYQVGKFAYARIGSSGKKRPGELSGDIDIAVSKNMFMSAKECFDAFELKEDWDAVYMSGLDIISIPFSQWGVANKKVQIDLMFVDNLSIAHYTYYSPHYKESEYKGIYRNELMAAIAKCMPVIYDNKMHHYGELVMYERYQWNLNTGLQKIRKERVPRKDGKGYTKKEIITEKETLFNDVDSMVKFIFGPHIDAYDAHTLEQVINIISKKNFKYYDQLEEILETAIGFYTTRKLGIPKEVQELYDNTIQKTSEDTTNREYG